MWHDTPGMYPPAYGIEGVVPLGAPKDPFIPINPTPWDSQETGAVDLKMINQHYYNFISIIEDSNEAHRFVCFLNELVIKNRGSQATSTQKFDIAEPSCHCEEQKREDGKWKTKDGRDNLPCGEAGLQ